MTLSDRVVDALVEHEAAAQEHGRDGGSGTRPARTRQSLIEAIEAEAEAEVATAKPVTVDSMSDAVEVLRLLAAGRRR